MKIILTKKHKLHSRELPKGTELRVSNELGKELIKKKVAKEFNGDTYEEKVETAIRVSMEEVETAEVKKQSLPTKRTKK